MKTYTITHNYTLTEEQLAGFAQFLQLQNATNVKGEDESNIDFVTRISKIHSNKFVTAWATVIKTQMLNQKIKEIDAQLTEQIVTPVESLLEVTITQNEQN